MLIISKYHDYYDTAHNGFIDKSIVYQRTPVQSENYLMGRSDYMKKTIKGKKVNIVIPYVGGKVTSKEWIENKDLFMVGFCGKFYIGLHHTKYDKIKCLYVIDKYIYNYDEMIKCLELKPENKRKWYGNYNRFVDFYNKYQGVEMLDMFLEYRCPIIYIGTDKRVVLEPGSYLETKIVLNPILKGIEFFKVIDSRTTFDRIATFISNILTNPEKEVVMSDKVKIESHGFDYKLSFRKDKKN